jgi:hypothetical protein
MIRTRTRHFSGVYHHTRHSTISGKPERKWNDNIKMELIISNDVDFISRLTADLEVCISDEGRES